MHIELEAKTSPNGGAFIQMKAIDGGKVIDAVHHIEVEMDGGSSRAFLRSLIKMLKNVKEGHITRIDFISLDNSVKGNTAFSRNLFYRLNGWRRNEFVGQSGEVLKTAPLLKLLCKQLDRLAVPQKDGSTAPIKVYVLSEEECYSKEELTTRRQTIARELRETTIRVREEQSACTVGNPLAIQEKVRKGTFKIA